MLLGQSILNNRVNIIILLSEYLQFLGFLCVDNIISRPGLKVGSRKLKYDVKDKSSFE